MLHEYILTHLQHAGGKPKDERRSDKRKRKTVNRESKQYAQYVSPCSPACFLKYKRLSNIELGKSIADTSEQAIVIIAGDGRCSSDLPHSPNHGVVLV